MSANSTTAVLKALVANGGIALSKGVAAAYTGSGAMLAEAIHSLADTLNQIFLLFGMKQAQKPATIAHPLGHGKVAYFWSLLVALMLFGLGSVFSLVEGIHRVLHPEPVEHLLPSIVVLILAVALESYSLKGALDALKEERGEKSLWAWFKSTRQPELMVVTGEDIGALGGLLTALVFLGLTALTGNPVFDALGMVAVGLLMGVISIAVLIEVKSLITGESASEGQRNEIQAILSASPEIKRVINTITLAWGGNVVLAVKAEMNPCGSDLQMVHAINAVEDRIQQRMPEVKWVFFEPDIR